MADLLRIMLDGRIEDCDRSLRTVLDAVKDARSAAYASASIRIGVSCAGL
jgi:hypothetical protein